jgi:hypothetical protein
MSFGPRHVIEDRYGQEVEVDIEMGDQIEIDLSITVRRPHPASTRVTTSTVTRSSLNAAQAEQLAEQLHHAAEEVRRYSDG